MLKDIIKKNNFKFKKQFGQNFISDEQLLANIVASANVDGAVVVEIGVGGATLTRALSKKAKKVIGFEIDKNLMPVISESLQGVENVEIVFKDFMKANLEELESEIGENYSVVANLPYYITTPIIMRFIEQSKLCERIVIMVQEEVALRLCAKNDTSDYGAITASIDSVGDAKIVSKVPRTMFFPQPNVDSAVVRIDVDRNKFANLDRQAFRIAVKLAFGSRRKTLVNNVINTFKTNREEAEQIISECNLNLNVRGETLSTEQFILLSEVLKSHKLI